MTIGSWVKKRDPIYFLAWFPLNLSFLPIFRLSILLAKARDTQQSCESLKNTKLLQFPASFSSAKKRGIHSSLPPAGKSGSVHQPCKAQPLETRVSLVLQLN